MPAHDRRDRCLGVHERCAEARGVGCARAPPCQPRLMRNHLSDSLLVLERGWLCSYSVLCFDAPGDATLVDRGYVTNAAQLETLVAHTLGGRRLTRIVNTHLHSDHCGGNAALQRRYGAAI